VSRQAVKPKFDDVLKEIDYIQDHLHVKNDYHAFVYWFIATLTGKDEQTIKTAICDGTHDKGIDAVLCDTASFSHSPDCHTLVYRAFLRHWSCSSLHERHTKIGIYDGQIDQ